MATHIQHTSSAAAPQVATEWGDARYQAFALLRIGFAVAPILFGLDKFAEVLVN